MQHQLQILHVSLLSHGTENDMALGGRTLQALNPQDGANMNVHSHQSIPAEPQLYDQGCRTTEMLGQLPPAARVL